MSHQHSINAAIRFLEQSLEWNRFLYRQLLLHQRRPRLSARNHVNASLDAHTIMFPRSLIVSQYFGKRDHFFVSQNMDLNAQFYIDQ